AQQLQHGGRQLVGLGQDRGGCLLQGLLLGQLGGFVGEVDVLDTTTGCSGVFHDRGQVGDGAVETVLHGTQVGALGVDVGDGLVNDEQGLLSGVGSLDLGVLDRGQLGSADRGGEVSVITTRNNSEATGSIQLNRARQDG